MPKDPPPILLANGLCDLFMLIWHSKEEHIKKLFPDLIEIKMAKRKTVKDLNEEFEVFKDRMNKMERVANLLDILNSDNLKVIEKKVK